MRVTRLNGCGQRVTAPGCNVVVSDGFVSVEVTANIDEGDEINVKNAAGKTCVSKKPAPEFTGYTVNITWCNVDADIFAMTTGQVPVLDPTTGDAIGFRVNTGRSGADAGFGLEVWSDVPGVTCPTDDQGNPIEGAEQPSGYILFPFLQGGVFGDFTIENDAVSFVTQGAVTKDGSGWGVGPYNVTLDGAGAPGKLTNKIEPKDHLHVQITYVAPPDPYCGCITPATGATAGTPGTWTPAGSDAPANLAALQGATPAIVASPTTAWTTGQRVVLGDGSAAHWSGTAWVAGQA